MRWLALVITFGLLSTATIADAQVFKPKGKKSDVATEKKATPKASSSGAKKSSTKTASKKKSGKKKSAAADRGRPDDLTPEPASKSGDDDFVKITDDEEIE